MQQNQRLKDKLAYNPFGEFIYLGDDPRSLTAMLQGNDDGRAKLFENFAALMATRTHHVSMEAISIKYATFELASYLPTRRLPDAWRQVVTQLVMRTRIYFGRI